MNNTVIVTQCPVFVDYLIEQGIVDKNNIPPVVKVPSAADVLNKHVIGILSHRLSCLTLTYTEPNLVLPPELIGKELTIGQLRKHIHGLDTYGVNHILPGQCVPKTAKKITLGAFLDRQ